MNFKEVFCKKEYCDTFFGKDEITMKKVSQRKRQETGNKFKVKE